MISIPYFQSIFLLISFQNPFLYGSFLLRKDHLKMQLERASLGGEGSKAKSVKEKTLYFPATFSNLEVGFHCNKPCNLYPK